MSRVLSRISGYKSLQHSPKFNIYILIVGNYSDNCLNKQTDWIWILQQVYCMQVS